MTGFIIGSVGTALKRLSHRYTLLPWYQSAKYRPNHPKLFFSVMLYTLLLSGCGFHLRGMIEIPRWFTNVAIISQNAPRDLTTQLKEQLQAYHVNVSAYPDLANYWLIIENDNFQQQITSVSSSTTPRQYQLIYTVLFKLQARDGKEIIPSDQVVVTRQITINGDRILGSDEEEAITKNEMIRDAVTQILNRLSKKL